MSTQVYATDLTDAEWDLIQPLLPAQPRTGRPRRHPWRTLLNAMCYQPRTGGAWRCLALPGSGMAAVADRLSLLAEMAARWDLGTAPYHAARAAARATGP